MTGPAAPVAPASEPPPTSLTPVAAAAEAAPLEAVVEAVGRRLVAPAPAVRPLEEAGEGGRLRLVHDPPAPARPTLARPRPKGLAARGRPTLRGGVEDDSRKQTG